MNIEIGSQEQFALASPAEVINGFRLRIRGIRKCAEDIVPKAKEIQSEAHQASITEFQKASVRLAENNPRVQAEALTILTQENSNRQLHYETPYDVLILQSFLKSAFSVFDAYLGELLKTIYTTNPHLLAKIEKQVGIADLLDVPTIESARELLVEKDIESIIRESYPTQFEMIARRFDVKTLTKFPNWKKFVESSQRRNLITHREGKVNTQYLVVCKRHDVDVGNDVKVGSILDVSLDYLCNSLDVIYEVGFKLGQVLWRKSARSGTGEADAHLINGIVDILRREDWEIASNMADFSVNCTSPDSEMNKRLMHINYAQALLWSGKKSDALAFLNKHDWSIAIRDLRLAVAVLREQYDEAADLVRHLGKKGELVNCRAYVDWPIFRMFRLTQQFRDAFKEVFGVSFEDEVMKIESTSAESSQ